MILKNRYYHLLFGDRTLPEVIKCPKCGKSFGKSEFEKHAKVQRGMSQPEINGLVQIRDLNALP